MYAYVKGKAKPGRNIGPLLNDQNDVIDSVEGMSQDFNKYFSSVLLRSDEVPEAAWMLNKSTSGLCDEINETKIVDKQLIQISPNCTQLQMSATFTVLQISVIDLQISVIQLSAILLQISVSIYTYLETFAYICK